jgi:hypothetical protein
MNTSAEQIRKLLLTALGHIKIHRTLTQVCADRQAIKYTQFIAMDIQKLLVYDFTRMFIIIKN